MIEHKFNNEQLKKYLEESSYQTNFNNNIIEQAKKNLEEEGLYQNLVCENEGSNDAHEEFYKDRKNSDISNERKNNEYFLEEFHDNMINEINLYSTKFGLEEAN